MSNQKTIVIIEDEPHLQEELTAAFVEAGFEVKNAYDGETGLALVRSCDPAMVLLDLILPKKDGFEVLKELKAGAQTHAIPVVVLSNLEMAKDVERVIGLGATSYLVKPNYDVSHIVEKIRGLAG